MKLNQIDAYRFINMKKIRKDNTQHFFPDTNGKLQIELTSQDQRQTFLIDINRSGVVALKCSYQNRVMVDTILIRLDINGPPHRNPDDTEIPSPHIHIYTEDYGDKWAYPLLDIFSDITKLDVTLDEFMDFCNVTQKPLINNIWNI